MKTVLQKDYKVIFEYCIEALKNIEATIIDQDINTGVIHGKKGMNLFSYGNKIEILLRPLTGDETEISITSESIGIQLFDWGKNKEIEEHIYSSLNEMIQ